MGLIETHRRTGFQFALRQIGQSFWLEQINLSADKRGAWKTYRNVLVKYGRLRTLIPDIKAPKPWELLFCLAISDGPRCGCNDSERCWVMLC